MRVEQCIILSVALAHKCYELFSLVRNAMSCRFHQLSLSVTIHTSRINLLGRAYVWVIDIQGSVNVTRVPKRWLRLRCVQSANDITMCQCLKTSYLYSTNDYAICPYILALAMHNAQRIAACNPSPQLTKYTLPRTTPIYITSLPYDPKKNTILSALFMKVSKI